MIELARQEREILAPLFAEHALATTIIDAILQGHHGRAWCDDAREPQVAMLELDSFAVFGGNPDLPAARGLVASLGGHEVVPDGRENAWAALVRNMHTTRCTALPRWDFATEGLDREHLRRLAAGVPDGYRVARIDARLVDRVKHEVDPALTENFEGGTDFLRRGVGFVALRGERLVAGVSSYCIADGGLEVEIDTHPEHRRRGLATVLAATLLGWCLDHGWYAHWDAANAWSAGLARKLGYQGERMYAALYVREDG